MDLNNSINSFKQFVLDNNIIGTSAGVCVALAAKDGIESLVGDIIIPGILFMLYALHIDFLQKYLPIKGNTQFKVIDFVKQMITFVLIIIVSFVFVQFSFTYLLNIKQTNKHGSSMNNNINVNDNLANNINTSAVTNSSNRENKFGNLL